MKNMLLYLKHIYSLLFIFNILNKKSIIYQKKANTYLNIFLLDYHIHLAKILSFYKLHVNNFQYHISKYNLICFVQYLSLYSQFHLYSNLSE